MARLAGVLVVLLILAALAAVLVASYSDKPREACPNVEPWVTPSSVLATACPVTPTPTPMYFVFGQEQPALHNAYTRDAPQGEDAPGWVELALPTGRWLIHSGECMLTPWVTVLYHTSAPNLAGINDCPLDAWIQQSTAPCAMDERGVCDLTLDQSYQDWLAAADQ